MRPAGLGECLTALHRNLFKMHKLVFDGRKRPLRANTSPHKEHIQKRTKVSLILQTRGQGQRLARRNLQASAKQTLEKAPKSMFKR